MPLTQAEMNFLTVRVLEGHQLDNPLHPARDAMYDLGIIPPHGAKLFEFEYLWQEQGKIDIFDPEKADFITVPPAPSPWPDATTFLRRWEEVLPESLARNFEKNHDPDRYRRLIQNRLNIWGVVEINPFTAEEAEFLDTLSDEIRTRFFGPCLRSLVACGIHHSYSLELIDRRRFELTEQGQSWPQPHRLDPPCPWLDRQSFTDRFDRELHCHLYYPKKESWMSGIRDSTPASGPTKSDRPAT